MNPRDIERLSREPRDRREGTPLFEPRVDPGRNVLNPERVTLRQPLSTIAPKGTIWPKYPATKR